MGLSVPLTECRAEIRSCDWGTPEAKQVTGMLWFYWQDHHYVIPFSETGNDIIHMKDGKAVGKSLVWKRVSGSTIEDLTLAPSYFCKAPPEYKLHCFIRDGKVVVV